MTTKTKMAWITPIYNIFCKFYKNNKGRYQEQKSNYILVHISNFFMQRIPNIFKFSQIKKLLTTQAYLKIRNSAMYELAVPMRNQQQASILVPKNGTLADLEAALKQQLEIKEVFFFCNQKHALPSSTLIDVLINRYFFIGTDKFEFFPVEGQLFDYGKSDEVIEGVAGLQLSAVTKREVQNYVTRVDQWIQFYTGKNILDDKAKIDVKTVRKIFIQSLIDPQPQQRLILQVQSAWEKAYWQVMDLKKKKREADQMCLKKVRANMSLGLFILGGNIMFIWSGTYIFYSWDIIEPLAYFVSSFGAIILAAQFFKLGRPYSNYAYQQYLMEKVSEKVYKQVGFSLENLKRAQNKLIHLESILKDYYLKRL